MGYYRRRGRRRGRWAWVAAAALLAAATGGVTLCRSQNFGLAAGRGEAADPAAATLVLYNSNDPLSRDLADFYAGQRGIEGDRVVGLACPTDEEITRQQYDETIAAPLRRLFDERQWWRRTADRPGDEPSSTVSANRIRFVALIRGIPLKVKPAANYPGDFSKQPAPLRDHNEASVDSEIAALGWFTRSISGPLMNPYFRSYKRFPDAGMPFLMLVGRLDAPTGSTVRRMIVDSLAAEKTGLWGRCYIDARGLKAGGGDPMAEGDAWMRRIAQADGAPLHLPTVLDDRPALFAKSYPMTGAAFYFGWYIQDVTGPFTRDDFRFQPGAVAFHLHSYSAVSVRDPAKWWVAPLLEKGAAASLGNVYEPYLGLTTHFDVFASRLFDGFTLAESAYAASPGVSWMNIVVGDPLYRPAAAWPQAAIDPPAGARGLGLEGRTYLQGAQTWRAQGAGPGAQALQKSGRALRSGLIMEGLGYLQAAAGDGKQARLSYDQALRFYKERADQARVILTEARLLADFGQTDKALVLLRGAGNMPALEEMINELAPAPRPEPPR